ncbi:MAG TPA: DinB family protein [Streptosporangiaceae bacterium]|nr:DinB family protein [Streptosporangiaceae bacterium]
MRWQPGEPVCPECGFAWDISRQAAIGLVAGGPEEATAAVRGVADPLLCDPLPWSASMYVWHLVDVLRIGAERLLTLAADPGRGIACWDENALADARRYRQLSAVVGLTVLRTAAREWEQAATAAPQDAVVSHPRFGLLDALDLIRRNAHEVHHHLLDIHRCQNPGHRA